MSEAGDGSGSAQSADIGTGEAERYREVLHRYGVETLEAMTAAQLRDAVLYLLAAAKDPVLTRDPVLPRDPVLASAPDKYRLETSLIDLGAALGEAQRNLKLLERDFYLAAFGRYDG